MKKNTFRRIRLGTTLGSVSILVTGCDSYTEAVLTNLWYGLPGLISGGFEGAQQWLSGASSTPSLMSCEPGKRAQSGEEGNSGASFA